MNIPKIGIGTYKLTPETTYSVVLEGLQLGYRHIDTASLYRNEKAVKRAIDDSKVPRDEIFVTTKIHIRDIRKGTVRQGFLESLQKLGRIDLLLLHGPVPGWRDAWLELVRIKEEGLVGEIGVSNFNKDEFTDSFSEFHRTFEKGFPKVNQIELSPFLPRVETVEFCKAKGIHVVAHSSLTKGYVFDNKLLVEMATRVRMTVPQILLCWGVQKGYCVLPRTSNPHHLEENLRVSHMKLPDGEMDVLDAIEERVITHRKWL